MKNKLVNAFNQVRDIPYKIPVSLGENDCCCSGKHMLLKKAFENLGYECRYRVCSFRWSDLKLPKGVCEAQHDDNSTHVYLEMKIDGEWKNIDATWDSGLSGVFHVNEWDGENDTEIAVPIMDLLSDEKSHEIMTNENIEVIRDDLKKNGEFYKAFNKWLEECRRLGN
ncbi:MAG: hypothetical protein HGB08_02860 [Candidatus Moranbacteria bacterium]|nr:hypothetical protein [Candidatus Moranbacteria bacterium]